MHKFGIIAHPVDFRQLWQLISISEDKKPIRSRPKKFIETVLKWTPPYQMDIDMQVVSATGDKIFGYGLLCPLLSYQMVTLKEELVLHKLIDAVNLAETLGAEIVGLAGFTSIVGNQGEKIAEKVNIPVTTGNTNTAAVIISQITSAATLLEIDIKNLTIAVIGATGDIGSACCRYLSDTVDRLVMCARDMDKLERFLGELNQSEDTQVAICSDPNEAVKDADIIIAVTSAVTTIVDVSHIKPGAIVCDAAMPKNIALSIAKKRDDILVFDGGMVKPYAEIPNHNFPGGLVYACIAETMLLTLEKRFECYSIGRGNIEQSKIKEMAAITAKHGFASDVLSLQGNIYTKEKIDQIKVSSQSNGMITHVA